MWTAFRSSLLGAVLVGFAVACGGSAGDSATSLDTEFGALEAAGPDGSCAEGKVVVCHVPPGNPANAHSICVGAPALPAHLAHGDTEGVCDDGVVVVVEPPACGGEGQPSCEPVTPPTCPGDDNCPDPDPGAAPAPNPTDVVN